MRVPTLILFAALLLGAGEGGVWGAFFAGPVMAVAYAMLEVFYERFSAGSPLFQSDDEDDDEVAPGAPKLDPASAASPQPDLWKSPEGRPAPPMETLKKPDMPDAQGANQGR